MKAIQLTFLDIEPAFFIYEEVKEEIDLSKLSDKELYLIYQKEYRAGNEKRINDIYNLCQKIAYKMILKEKLQKGFVLCDEEIENKSYNCASYITERLFKIPDFEISEIGGYIYLRVKHELYYRTKLDECLKTIKSLEPDKYFTSGEI